MKFLKNPAHHVAAARIVVSVVLFSALTSTALAAVPPLRGAPAPKAHNWTAPKYKMAGQELLERIDARHPELLSISIHAEVPGAGLSTLAFSANPEKVGEPNGPDDNLALEAGYTMIDHRWRRIDPIPKFGISTPLRDEKGENIGLLVLIFKNDPALNNNEVDLYRRATEIRAEFQREITSHAWMFQRAD